MAALLLLASATLGQALFQDLPKGFDNAAATWAFYSYEDPGVAVLPGAFNRSAFDAPHESETSDDALTKANELLNQTDFIAYDSKFFDILGPKASIKHVHQLAYQSHEAPCYNDETKELFFVEWGPPGGDQYGGHNWQYMLNTKTNKLRNVTMDPPLWNAHGCVIYEGKMYIVTDGNRTGTGQLVKVDPKTLKQTVVLNNYYQQPFMGFNDLDIDSDGNFWLTDSKSGAGRDVIPSTPPTNPTVYRVNGKTLRPQVVHTTTGNANGVAVSEVDGKRIVYLPDTGVSEFKPVSRKNPYGDRGLYAYDTSSGGKSGGGTLKNKRLLNNPISYFYDGIRVSRNGWIFAGAGDGVDVIDPESGLSLGTIRVGGGENLAVSMTFGEHEMWIVGRGGVWHVSGIKERLARDW